MRAVHLVRLKKQNLRGNKQRSPSLGLCPNPQNAWLPFGFPFTKPGTCGHISFGFPLNPTQKLAGSQPKTYSPPPAASPPQKKGRFVSFWFRYLNKNTPPLSARLIAATCWRSSARSAATRCPPLRRARGGCGRGPAAGRR